MLAAERLHGDDTTVPVLAKGKTDTGRVWVYVRDDRAVRRRRSAGGAVLLLARPPRRASRSGISPAMRGILQADAYGGYNRLYDAGAQPGPVSRRRCAGRMRGASSSCWPTSPRAPRKAQGKTAAVISPLALEAVSRIDALFDIERAINGARRRTAPRRPPGAQRAAGRRAGSLDARGARQAVAPAPSRQGHGLHAEALGRASPASSTTAGSASPTTPPSARCAASPSAASHGCSPAPTAAASGRRSCTP